MSRVDGSLIKIFYSHFTLRVDKDVFDADGGAWKPPRQGIVEIYREIL